MMEQNRRGPSSALDVNEFGRLRIGLATADSIRTWSNGEVKKPETINYRTLKPEKDGLFCEKIFGPQKDWECSCGKYKRIRFRGIICERCGVEVTRTKVRRERMGHIELAAPVVHIWYLRGTRSWLAYLLTGTEPKEEVKAKQLEKVVYFAAHLVVRVDTERRHGDLPELERDMHEELRLVNTEFDKRRQQRQLDLEAEIEELEAADGAAPDIRNRRAAAERELEELEEMRLEELEKIENAFDVFQKLYPRQIIEDEELWNELRFRYEDYFDGGMGADAIARLIDESDFDSQEEELRRMVSPAEGVKPLSAQRKHKAIRRLRIVSAFNTRDDHGRRINDPRAVILDVVPVIPPDLRPMVQLDGGRFATSDLNDLYRRVINRNNRLKRLLDLGAPEIIVNNERRMLQEAVDALFDNGRRGRPVTGPGNRPLKSLSDMLKGKQGRFRQNLLGKRVDYSGRSVIVVGPTLKFHQCGLPRLMALELFKPFVMKNLVENELAPNIKSAKRMVERRRPEVWDVLEEVIREHPVLLNRAPTLHRLGIQAFEAVLVGGKAIQIHPLVCAAFNADFDGDQMAVHLPLSAEAQAEARVLMLSANNVLSPAHGSPLVVPTQDMLIGSYYLTLMNPEDGEAKRIFRNADEVTFAHEAGLVDLHTRVEYRIEELRRPAGDGESAGNGSESGYEPTTVGRIWLNELMPEDFGFINTELKRSEVGRIVERLARNYPKAVVARSLDGLKDLCFRYATQSGLTISLEDIKVPADKPKILDRREKQAQQTERQFRRGIITDGERRQKEIETWLEATQEVQNAMVAALRSEELNPVNMMVDSGARGNMMQIRQIAGMRGVVANPRGDMISRPIKSNFREGLSVLEYFISTPGARKGLVDTALRTADSGYLTRRLVDVAQELIINDEDPFESNEPVPGIHVELRSGGRPLEVRLLGRILADDITLDDGTTLPAGEMVSRRLMERIENDTVLERVRVLSPLTDNSLQGISAKSYGMSLATGSGIETGEAVGVIAAQSIGEPGTQLTMRTFHTGGAMELGRAVSDIARGLPRVVELFEARTPKGKATLARSSGVLRVEEPDAQQQRLSVIAPDGTEEKHLAVVGARLEVADGEEVEAGDVLVDGNVDPKELLEIKGLRAVQQYLVDEVQEVYREQGVSIHDKHIELIVRQMTRRVLVQESGDSGFLPGERVDARRYRDVNRRLITEDRRPAQGRPELMGITKASLATDSWLSAASFQTTTQVLTESAIESRSDDLSGLKENIMIGKLIPAGTGIAQYRNIRPHAPDYVPMEVYSEDYDGFAEGYADVFGVAPEALDPLAAVPTGDLGSAVTAEGGGL